MFLLQISCSNLPEQLINQSEVMNIRAKTFTCLIRWSKILFNSFTTWMKHISLPVKSSWEGICFSSNKLCTCDQSAGPWISTVHFRFVLCVCVFSSMEFPNTDFIFCTRPKVIPDHLLQSDRNVTLHIFYSGIKSQARMVMHMRMIKTAVMTWFCLFVIVSLTTVLLKTNSWKDDSL